MWNSDQMTTGKTNPTLFSLSFSVNRSEALIYNFSTIKAPTYSSVVTGDYDYPPAGIAIAFFLVLSSITMIPIYTVKGYKFQGYEFEGFNFRMIKCNRSIVFIVKKTKDENPSMSLAQIWHRLKTAQLPDHHPWKEKMATNEKCQISAQEFS